MPILSIILFAPLAGALLLIAIPREDTKTIHRVGLSVAFLSLVLAIAISVQVAQMAENEILLEKEPWIEAFSINYALGADGLNAPLLLLTAIMTTLSLSYASRTIEMRVKEFFILFMMLETSLFGVFLARDMVMFYIFWVVSLMPILLLISVWGGEERERAALKLFLYNLLGSVGLLIAILAVYSQTGTFDVLDASRAHPFLNATAPGAARAAFLAFFFAFAIRLPSFPFHTWLPDAQTKAPTAVSTILASVFLGTGGYGLIRIALPLFPDAFRHYVVDAPLIPILAVLSIIYTALVCLAQWDLKRLVSYSSVVQMGFVTLGVCAAAASYQDGSSAALSGLGGAAMQIVSHGILIAGLLFLAGILQHRTHTYDLRVLGGLSKQLPHYYGLTLVMGFAALGLPGLIGFWGQFLVFKGIVAAIPVYGFLGVLGVLFAAGYTLWKIVQHIFMGPLDEERWGQMEDMVSWEKGTIWPLVLITVVLGFYPTPLLDMLDAALKVLLNGLLL